MFIVKQFKSQPKQTPPTPAEHEAANSVLETELDAKAQAAVDRSMEEFSKKALARLNVKIIDQLNKREATIHSHYKMPDGSYSDDYLFYGKLIMFNHTTYS